MKGKLKLFTYFPLNIIIIAHYIYKLPVLHGSLIKND